ncbi:MAG: hypothetical protein AAF485_07985, partial [Chloroflexota bacterium]
LFFLTPTLFINPPPTYWAAIAYAEKYAHIDTTYTIVPTVVSISGYFGNLPFTDDSSHLLSATSVALWPFLGVATLTVFVGTIWKGIQR